MLGNKFLFNKDLSLYCSVTDKPVTLAGIIINYGFESKELERGYAHLIEHMVIKSNQKYFEYLEENGVIFNAGTQEDCILFTFIDFKSGFLENEIDTLKNILFTEFASEDLETEKKTIAQEHLYRCERYTKKAIDEAMGSIDEISAFNLDKLNKYRKTILASYKLLLINQHSEQLKEDFVELRKQHINNDWYKDIEIESVVESDEKISIKFEKNIFSEMLLYNLKILCMCSFCGENIKIIRDEKHVTVEISFSKEKFISLLSEKKQSFSRYILFLDSIKMYYQEIAYIIRNIGFDFDLEKSYFSDWEVKILEKITQ